MGNFILGLYLHFSQDHREALHTFRVYYDDLIFPPGFAPVLPAERETVCMLSASRLTPCPLVSVSGNQIFNVAGQIFSLFPFICAAECEMKAFALIQALRDLHRLEVFGRCGYCQKECPVNHRNVPSCLVLSKTESANVVLRCTGTLKEKSFNKGRDGSLCVAVFQIHYGC